VTYGGHDGLDACLLGHGGGGDKVRHLVQTLGVLHQTLEHLEIERTDRQDRETGIDGQENGKW
jgi:hypothetical protein